MERNPLCVSQICTWLVFSIFFLCSRLTYDLNFKSGENKKHQHCVNKVALAFSLFEKKISIEPEGDRRVHDGFKNKCKLKYLHLY